MKRRRKQAPQVPPQNPQPHALPTVANGGRNNSPSDHDWWFNELWHERRELFKGVAEHLVSFVVVIVLLVIIGFIIHHSPLPELVKITLEILDAVAATLLLLVLSGSLIFNVVSETLSSARKKREAENLLKEKMRKVFEQDGGIIGEEVNQLVLEELKRMRERLKK